MKRTERDRADPGIVDWDVERAHPVVARRGLKRLIVYRAGRRYTRSGLPPSIRPALRS
jgi:hypothetical protein